MLNVFSFSFFNLSLTALCLISSLSHLCASELHFLCFTIVCHTFAFLQQRSLPRKWASGWRAPLLSSPPSIALSPSSPSLSLSFLSFNSFIHFSLTPSLLLPLLHHLALSKIIPFHPFLSTPLSLYFCRPCSLFSSLSCVHLFFICCTDYRSL